MCNIRKEFKNISLKGLLVPLLTSKNILRPSGKYKYVYYTLRAYKNDKGQPSSETVCFGRLDSNPKLMIPNDKYYEYFNEEPIDQERSVKSILNYGTCYDKYQLLNFLILQ